LKLTSYGFVSKNIKNALFTKRFVAKSIVLLHKMQFFNIALALAWERVSALGGQVRVKQNQRRGPPAVVLAQVGTGGKRVGGKGVGF
jgi:hypothetical protein